MCGIFGLIAKQNYSEKFLKDIFFTVAELSESRGKESSGFAFKNKNEFRVLRSSVSVKELMCSIEFQNEMGSIFDSYNGDSECPIIITGHSRLVTNGSQIINENNQPVVKNGLIGLHNGIIVNDLELWKNCNGINQEFDIDTEVLLALIRYNMSSNDGVTVVDAMQKAFSSIEGTVSTCILFNDYDLMFLGTNNGSLYVLTNGIDFLLFASEKHILLQILNKKKDLFNKGFNISQITANSGLFIDLEDFKKIDLKLRCDNSNSSKLYIDKKKSQPFVIKEIKAVRSGKINSSLIDLNRIATNPVSILQKKLLDYNYNEIEKLQRCSICLLPETFPFIKYNNQGVCNYCTNYKSKNDYKPRDILLNLTEKYRNENGKPDCLIPFSGGRDSSYVVHFVTRELKMHPITLTYDWGMVTDLARRNIARVCGKLGIENIIVSADIRWKRENIKKNIEAWLKKPELGMIPLFMAGDKYFFYHAHKVKQQNGIKLNFWGINNLENTDFKVGFCGVAPSFDKKRIYSLNFQSQMRLFSFVGKNIMSNPSYINQSIFDTLGSFLVRYFYPKKDYFHLFDYLRWDEKNIEDTLISEYKWETAIDTKSTWRIGDGTASFYNYIYNTVAGFSENDTFRSNQIREGMITREEGLKLVYEENKPRYETLKWYLDILGLDFEDTINKINKIPKYYRH